MGELAEMYEKDAEGLLRFAASLVGPSDAADVVSSAVLGVLRSNIDSVVNIRSYMYRAVYNASRKHWRSKIRRTRREKMFGAKQPRESEYEDPDIAAALRLLSPQQRAAIHLAYWEDLTPGAISSRLGITDGTVRRHLARARKRLREELNDEQS